VSGAGKRDKLIRILQVGAPVDDGYTTHPGEHVEFTRAWAEVRFGTGEERRQAAQEHASIPATFVILATPKTRQVTPEYKVRFMDADWDISSSIPGRDASEWQITATRSA
jgi:head-tail adaptor